MAARFMRGWLTGKFCMAHQGHINFIHQSATQCDELHVVISQDDNRFKDPRLSLRNRILWMKTIFKDMPHIKIYHVNETGTPEYTELSQLSEAIQTYEEEL